MSEIDSILGRYREGAAGTSCPTANEANKWHEVMHAQFKILRNTVAGQAGIMALMLDPDPHVRLWAASHSLQWDMRRSRATLEAIRDNGGPCSFSAGITLQELDKGRLNIRFDY